MRYNRTKTDRTDNFERRLNETMGSELEPEQVTPNTAGYEELTTYEENFTMVKEFNQKNMRSGHPRLPHTQHQEGLSND